MVKVLKQDLIISVYKLSKGDHDGSEIIQDSEKLLEQLKDAFTEMFEDDSIVIETSSSDVQEHNVDDDG